MNILHILTLIFVVCKVGEIGTIATWSWWLVLAPSLLCFVLVFLFLALAVWASDYK